MNPLRVLVRIAGPLLGLALALASLACAASGKGEGPDAGGHETGMTMDSGTPDMGMQMFPDGYGGPDTGMHHGGGGDGGAEAAGPFTVGGNVTGLRGGGLVLQNNGADNVSLPEAGVPDGGLVEAGAFPFTFPSPVANGGKYDVTVMTQPTTPSQTCVVKNGTGKVKDANVTNVGVSCTTSTFTIGGMLSGLSSGDSVVLQDNGKDNLTLTANGAFTFKTKIASGSKYAVTVKTQPSSPAESCYVSKGAGTVGAADVTSVTVTCAPAGVDCGRFSSGFTGTWATVTANPFSSGMGMSGYLPSGSGPVSFYAMDGSSLDSYTASTSTYATLASPSVSFTAYSSMAFFSNALWSFQGTSLVQYDIGSDTWSTPATGLTVETYSQTAVDGAGVLWGYQSESTLLAYDTSSGTSTTMPLTTPFTFLEPRVVYDSCSGLLYLAEYDATPFYSFDPATGTQTALSGLPGGASFQDGFCNDRSGHIFAFVNATTMYQYTIATDTWVAMPAGPIGNSNSACGVGADGYLYATDPAESSTMYQIQLN